MTANCFVLTAFRAFDLSQGNHSGLELSFDQERRKKCLARLRKPKKKKLLVSFTIKPIMRVFYFPAGRGDKIFGYAPGASLCSFTAAKETECGFGMNEDLLWRS